jgi:hypothetical protein
MVTLLFEKLEGLLTQPGEKRNLVRVKAESVLPVDSASTHLRSLALTLHSPSLRVGAGKGSIAWVSEKVSPLQVFVNPSVW